MEKQMHEFITELNTTYDANLFDNQSESLQQKCLDYSTINKNKDTKDIKGKVLMELLYNHYAKDKPTAEFIGGPKTLSIHWHPQYKKIIYIFGEMHANTMDCEEFKTTTKTPSVPVEDYLYDLMKSTDVFLDIYFEFFFPNFSDMQGRSDRIYNIFNKFKKCLLYDSRHKKFCRLARSHYFDIRTISSNPLNLEESKIDIVWVMSFLRFVKKSLYRNSGITRGMTLKHFLDHFLEQKPIIIDILRKLTDTNNENIYQFMLKQLKENRYIKKELGKIVENRENLISAFNAFFYAKLRLRIDSNIHTIKRSVNTLLNYKTTSDDELNDNLDVFLKAMLLPISCFADAYLLARVFKDFNMSEMAKKAYKGATHQPNRAHNIIIYAGEAHSHYYRDFLSLVGFTEIDSSGIDLDNPNPFLHLFDKPKNCLDMRNIQQPFFSYKRYDQSSFKVIKQSKRLSCHFPYK